MSVAGVTLLGMALLIAAPLARMGRPHRLLLASSAPLSGVMAVAMPGLAARAAAPTAPALRGLGLLAPDAGHAEEPS